MDKFEGKLQRKEVMKYSDKNSNIFFEDSGMFGPEDVAKLDSVLANVNTILESLDGNRVAISRDSLVDVTGEEEVLEDKNVIENNAAFFNSTSNNFNKRTRAQTFPSANITDKACSDLKTTSYEHTGRHDTSTVVDSHRSCPIRNNVIFRYNQGSTGRLREETTVPPANSGKQTFGESCDRDNTSGIKSDDVFIPHTENKFPSEDQIVNLIPQRRKQSEYDNVIKAFPSSTSSISDTATTPEEPALFRSSTILGETDKPQLFVKKKLGISKSSDYADTVCAKSLELEYRKSPDLEHTKKSKSRIAQLLPRRSSTLRQALSPKLRRKNYENDKSKSKARYSVNLEDIPTKETKLSDPLSTESKTKTLPLKSSNSFGSKKSPLRRKGKSKYHNLKLNLSGGYRRALSLDETIDPPGTSVSGFHTATGIECQRQPTFEKQSYTKKIYYKFIDSFRSSQTDLSLSCGSNVHKRQPDCISDSSMTPDTPLKPSKSEPTLCDCSVYPPDNNIRKMEAKKTPDKFESSFFANPYSDEDGPGIPRRQTIDSTYVRHRRKPTTAFQQPTMERHSVEIWKRFTKKHNPDDRSYSSLPRSKQSKSSKKINRLSWQNDKSFKISTTVYQQYEMGLSTKGTSNKKAWKQQNKQESGEKIWWAMGHGIWSNMGGRSVELEEANLLQLSESECDALQEIAMKQLNKIDLGVALSCPKDEFKMMNQKNSFMKKYGLPSHHKNKNKADTTHVFGIPLVRVVENDQLLRLQTADENLDGVCNSNDSSPQNSRHESRCSSPEEFSLDKDEDGTTSPSMSPKLNSKSNRPTSNVGKLGKPLQRRRAIAASSLEEIDPTQTKLLEALVSSGSQNKKLSLIPHTMLQVPYVVQKCTDHIVKHGLNIVGIFRVAGSKKRVNQLRKDFDRSVDVELHDDYNPHDVAALLKEFIRDLPEALLTRTLYSAFISVTKLPRSIRLLALQCLVWLLPIPNRDTLYSLLSFLHTVAANAEDKTNENGETVPGNKMNVMNLATIFGPNILHRNKKSKDSSEHQYQVQSADRAEESTQVISVVQEMILNYQQLFLIPCDVHDDMLRTLKERDPDAVDFLLRRKAGNHMRDKSGEFTKLENNTVEVTCDLRNSDDSDVIQSDENGEAMSICQSQSKNNNKSPSEEKTIILPRLSYEQATGHIMNTYGGKGRREARRTSGRKHKPEILSINQPHQQHSTTETSEISPSPSSPSLTYSPLFLDSRSVSFSDEDLRDIFQSEAIRKSHLRKLSQVNEEEPSRACNDCMIDEYIETFECNVDLSQNENNSTGNKRRGGFSVKPVAESGLGSAASLVSNSPVTESQNTTIHPHPDISKDGNNNTKLIKNNYKMASVQSHEENYYEEPSPPQLRKRLPSGLNLTIHGKYFSNHIEGNGVMSRGLSSTLNRRRSKDDMFISKIKINHCGQYEHTDEVPNKDEIAKWQSWSNNKQNVKPIKLHSQTLV